MHIRHNPGDIFFKQTHIVMDVGTGSAQKTELRQIVKKKD